MKKSEAILGVGLLASILVAVGAVVYATMSAQSNAAALAELRQQSILTAQRERELQKNIADAKAEVIAAKMLSEERGRELSTIRSQNAELEKQAADFKTKAASPRTDTTVWSRVQRGRNTQGFVLGANGQVINIGGELPEEAVQQLNNTIQLTTGIGANGVITINGDAIKLPGNLIGEEPVRIQLNGIPPPEPTQVAPAPEEAKKKEQVNEQF